MNSNLFPIFNIYTVILILTQLGPWLTYDKIYTNLYHVHI